MVSTPQPLSAGAPAASTRFATKGASLSARFFAYLIDSVVLLGFVLAFLALAGLVLWLSSNLGKEDPPDSAYYAFIGIFIGGTIISWSVFNIVLMLWRRQTAGQYIAGLRIVCADESTPSTGQTLLRWFALHPLLFHPLLIPVWALFAAITVSLTLSQFVFAVTLGLVALCIVAPAAALVAALLDRDRRSLYDRASGTIVIPVKRR